MGRASFTWDEDADYVIWEDCGEDGVWVEHMRWMVPGTWVEDTGQMPGAHAYGE